MPLVNVGSESYLVVPYSPPNAPMVEGDTLSYKVRVDRSRSPSDMILSCAKEREIRVDLRALYTMPQILTIDVEVVFFKFREDQNTSVDTETIEAELHKQKIVTDPYAIAAVYEQYPEMRLQHVSMWKYGGHSYAFLFDAQGGGHVKLFLANRRHWSTYMWFGGVRLN